MYSGDGRCDCALLNFNLLPEEASNMNRRLVFTVHYYDSKRELNTEENGQRKRFFALPFHKISFFITPIYTVYIFHKYCVFPALQMRREMPSVLCHVGHNTSRARQRRGDALIPLLSQIPNSPLYYRDTEFTGAKITFFQCIRYFTVSKGEYCARSAFCTEGTERERERERERESCNCGTRWLICFLSRPVNDSPSRPVNARLYHF